LNTVETILVSNPLSNSVIVGENASIMLDYNGTAPTQGDGTLKLILTYRVIEI